MRRLILTMAILIGLTGVGRAQFDCSNGFSTSGSCGLNLTWEYKGTPFKVAGADAVHPTLDGTKLDLYPAGTNHRVSSLSYQTAVDVRSFHTEFRFIPNGLFLSFYATNTTTSGYRANEFTAGAGCEAGFFQGYGAGANPNNVFALDFDNYDPLQPYQNAPWDFAHNSVQIYQSNLAASEYPNTLVQCPCIGGSSICGDNSNPNVGDHQITKLSTEPVSMNYPVNEGHTTTGDTYSASLNYDGTNLKLDLYDVTDGDSCPGAKCFEHTWNNVDIPHSANGETAYVGLVATSGSYDSKYPLYVNSWSYAAGTGPVPTPAPSNAPTPSPGPTPGPGAGNCTFTSPNGGSATWSCSPQAASYSSFPSLENRPSPAPTSAPPSGGNCKFTTPAGTASWSCS